MLAATAREEPMTVVTASWRAAVLAAFSVLSGCTPIVSRPIASGEEFGALEARVGGRLGVFVLDTATGQGVGHRAGERFGMCSTFKLALAAVVLREVDAGRIALDERLTFGAADMIAHAPVATQHLATGWLTIVQAAQAAQETSDNVAANLLLRRLGGPAAFTTKLRELGDATTRLDRYEPEMNLVPPGEVRDTTTPEAMARLVARFVLGDALSSPTRESLTQWTIATTTGARRIRAGLPADWRAGDKTGSGWNEAMANKVNDVAIVWPPGRAPLVIAAFYEAPGAFDAMRAEDEAVLAEVGRIVADLR